MRNTRFVNLSLAVAATLIFLILLEAGSRFCFDEEPDKPLLKFFAYEDINKDIVAVKDDLLGYSLKPGNEEKGFFIDVWGQKTPIEKSKGTFRIVCLGGSTTFGTGANAESTYPALLQKMFEVYLAGCDLRVEIINAGMMGYNSWHSLLRVAYRMNELSPDMYLFMDGFNDVTSAMSLDEEFTNTKEKLTILVNKTSSTGKILAEINQLLSRLRFYQILRRAASQILERTPKGVNEVKKRIQGFGYKENMEHIIDIAEEQGAAVAIVNYPWLTRMETDYESERNRIPFHLDDVYFGYFQEGRRYISEVNRSLAEEKGVPVFDPQPLIDELTRDGENIYRYYVDCVHFTRFGNYHIALTAFNGLIHTQPLKGRLKDCRSRSIAEVAAIFHDQTFLDDAYVTGCRYPDKPDQAFSTTIISQDNIREMPADGGWSFLTPDDPTRPGVVKLIVNASNHPLEKRINGFNAIFYPRFRDFDDSIAIIDKGGPFFKKRKQSIDNNWTPVSDQNGLALPINNEHRLEFEIVLTGKAQVMRLGSKIFFYNLHN